MSSTTLRNVWSETPSISYFKIILVDILLITDVFGSVVHNIGAYGFIFILCSVYSDYIDWSCFLHHVYYISSVQEWHISMRTVVWSRSSIMAATRRLIMFTLAMQRPPCWSVVCKTAACMRLFHCVIWYLYICTVQIYRYLCIFSWLLAMHSCSHAYSIIILS